MSYEQMKTFVIFCLVLLPALGIGVGAMAACAIEIVGWVL